jgi:hypothetical protein
MATLKTRGVNAIPFLHMRGISYGAFMTHHLDGFLAPQKSQRNV